nr:hypothetical protein CFP56_68479 [Quercus suber]
MEVEFQCGTYSSGMMNTLELKGILLVSLIKRDIKFKVDEQILELKGKILVSLISCISSNYSRSEIIERECLDRFEKLECEAFDIFVNEVLCVGKGCPYSCVERAPHAFSFASTGSAKGFFTRLDSRPFY